MFVMDVQINYRNRQLWPNFLIIDERYSHTFLLELFHQYTYQWQNSWKQGETKSLTVLEIFYHRPGSRVFFIFDYWTLQHFYQIPSSLSSRLSKTKIFGTLGLSKNFAGFVKVGPKVNYWDLVSANYLKIENFFIFSSSFLTLSGKIKKF